MSSRIVSDGEVHVLDGFEAVAVALRDVVEGDARHEFSLVWPESSTDARALLAGLSLLAPAAPQCSSAPLAPGMIAEPSPAEPRHAQPR